LTPAEPQAVDPEGVHSQGGIHISGLVEAPAPLPPPPAGPQPAPEAEAPGGHLHLVAPRRRGRPMRRVVLSFLAAGVLVVSFGLVGLHVVIAEAQFRLDKLQQQTNTAQARYEKLRLSVAELQAPGRIVSRAEQLGMRQPGTETFLPAPGVRRTGASGSPAQGKVAAGSTGTGTTSPANGPRHGEASASEVPDVVRAPAGDADWPSIKPFLNGSP
jgi:cell division protein FtsL